MRSDDEPPGCSWAVYVELLVAAHGGWAPVVDMLLHRARGVVELPSDPQTIERGLRRLSGRGNAPGGKYGRWLLRFFGVPEPLARTARWMGQYHSRFADLPLSLCESQLRTWDRPPICESSVAAWIHLGLAAVAMRRRELVDAAARLARARPLASAAGREAELEAVLLDARLASERGDAAAVERELDRAEQLTSAIEQADERACYQARIVDQRAYRLLHPHEGAARVSEARALYAAIDEHVLVPFVRFRRAHGLGYCEWKLGHREHAMTLAREAAEHAADGGLVRFRVMAFTLQAAIADGDEALALRQRAERMAAMLEHEDLLGAG